MSIPSTRAMREEKITPHLRYDINNAQIERASFPVPHEIKIGVVEQFNVGLYSAVVSSSYDTKSYICYLGAVNVTPSFGYSDLNVLREGDEVIFTTPRPGSGMGMILAKKPMLYEIDNDHPDQIHSDNDQENRTSFLSSDCCRMGSQSYTTPLCNPNDPSTRAFHSNRPTDVVPGEMGTLNQHHCGILGGQYSTSLVGGGAHIRLFSLENRIRMVADSIIRHTTTGNDYDWHNRRYLSRETSTCLYQEERLGMPSPGNPAFKEADYHKEGYYTKNSTKGQTSRPRILDMTGFYGNMSTKYGMRPDPDETDLRAIDARPMDPGVCRESLDPSGQYRFAATGMISSERIGRIPVPFRINRPWQNEVGDKKLSDLKLTPFQHDEKHPGYRQLELADRVAYDLANSYSRTEYGDEFYTPEEQDLENKVRDVYDPGFTESETVKLQKYDKRRSGIWQGEDGSIILRDAWGSEIVMIGGNIQLSCAGNIQIMPGKTSLTIAGDDIVQKAQNSIDLQSADKDVRINAVRNVQIMSGIDDDHPGGITLESKGKSGPWGTVSEKLTGESMPTSGIFLKSESGTVAADSRNIMLRSRSTTSLVSAESDDIKEGKGKIVMSSASVFAYGKNIIAGTDTSNLILSTSAILTGSSAGVIGEKSAFVIKGEKAMVPLMWVDIGTDIYNEIDTGIEPLTVFLQTESQVSLGYSAEELDLMRFKFRSSSECGTTGSWELGDSGGFRLYEPFWSQVSMKFETLKGISSKEFEDHSELWDEKHGNPWPGKDALSSATYVSLSGEGPANMDEHGFNVARSNVSDHTQVKETTMFPGYLIRD